MNRIDPARRYRRSQDAYVESHDSYHFLDEPYSLSDRGVTFLRRRPFRDGVTRSYRETGVEAVFRARKRRVEDETRYSSSYLEVALNPDYQAIVDLGADVVPFLLRDTAMQNTARWLSALEAIVGEDVAVDAESVKGACQAWVRWGSARGYL